MHALFMCVPYWIAFVYRSPYQRRSCRLRGPLLPPPPTPAPFPGAKRLQSAGRPAGVCSFSSRLGPITSCSVTGERAQTSGVWADLPTGYDRPSPPHLPHRDLPTDQGCPIRAPRCWVFGRTHLAGGGGADSASFCLTYESVAVARRVRRQSKDLNDYFQGSSGNFLKMVTSHVKVGSNVKIKCHIKCQIKCQSGGHLPEISRVLTADSLINMRLYHLTTLPLHICISSRSSIRGERSANEEACALVSWRGQHPLFRAQHNSSLKNASAEF